MFDLAALDEKVLLGVADALSPSEVHSLVEGNIPLTPILRARRPEMIEQCRAFKPIVLQRLSLWDGPRILTLYQSKRPALFHALYTPAGYAWFGRQIDLLKQAIQSL